MTQTIYQVDAFTAKPFSGNPAAVTILEEPKSAEWMQSVALEMNLSETAFLQEASGGYDLRWFTPTTEIELCGHATLASAHILWEQDLAAKFSEIRFFTLSGMLAAHLEEGMIHLNFPTTHPKTIIPDIDVKAAFGVEPAAVLGSRFDHLIVIEDEKIIRELKPDMNALLESSARGFIVTARSGGKPYDFISRFFAPGAGIPEDPVTGSAHCTLAPYWSEILDKQELLAFQASKRGGVVSMQLKDERVVLGGEAVTVMEAELKA